MLWKKELIKRKPIYVNLFQAIEFYPMNGRFFDDFDLNGNEKTMLKSNAASDAVRYIAIKMKKEKKNPEEILPYINEAICLAKIDSENMGLAYGLRAECFDKLKQYAFSLADIELAKKHKYPVEAMSRLEELKSECSRKLSRKNAQPIDHDDAKLSFSENVKIPCFAEGLEVKHTKKYGKHIITTRDLDIGQTVIVEEAYCMAPKIDQNYLQCANCFERKVNLIPCNKCSVIMFCSQKCNDVGHEKFHAFECGKRDVSTISEPLPRLVMRTVINAIKMFPKIEDLMSIIDNVNNGKPNNAVNYVDPSIRAYMRFFWLNKSIEHISHSQDIQFMNFTRTIHSIIATCPEYKSMFGSLEESRFLAHLICHHFYVVDSNAFNALSLLNRIYTNELGIADIDNLCGFSYAHGIYLNSCQLNHSCQPNIARIYMGTKLVGKVIRPIKSGEQLFVSYL